MSRQKKSFITKLRRLGAREQLLILTGSLLVAILALAIVPLQSAPEVYTANPPNELERRDAISAAADAYYLAENVEERQAAARHLTTVRAELDSPPVNRVNTIQRASNLLRFILILSILGISFRLFTIVIAELKLKQSQKA